MNGFPHPLGPCPFIKQNLTYATLRNWCDRSGTPVDSRVLRNGPERKFNPLIGDESPFGVNQRHQALARKENFSQGLEGSAVQDDSIRASNPELTVAEISQFPNRITPTHNRMGTRRDAPPPHRAVLAARDDVRAAGREHDARDRAIVALERFCR